MLEFCFLRFKLEGVDLQSLAERCPSHLTGADLYALCADAMLTSLRRQVAFLEEKGEGGPHALLLSLTRHFSSTN